MSDGLSWTAIGVVSSLCVIGIGGLFGLLLSINWKLAALVQKVDGLADKADDNASEHTRIWERIDEHSEKIARLEK